MSKIQYYVGQIEEDENEWIFVSYDDFVDINTLTNASLLEVNNKCDSKGDGKAVIPKKGRWSFFK
jgi:hypothetical protein